MSLAGSYGSLLAAAAALLVVSCARNVSRSEVSTRGSVRIRFNCPGANVNVGLLDDNGNSAWKIRRNRGQSIAWTVQDHVTINSIRLKTGGPIPVQIAHNPSGPGTPLDGTVSGDTGRSSRGADRGTGGRSCRSSNCSTSASLLHAAPRRDDAAVSRQRTIISGSMTRRTESPACRHVTSMLYG